MSCISEIQLQEYLEGNVQSLEKVIIEEHLKTCSNCKSELLALKLLLWELNEIKKAKPEIPAEVSKVRGRVLNELFEGNQDTLELAEILHLQRNNFANASTFVKFIPGVKTGQHYLKQGLNRAPSAAFSLSGSILKSGFKMLQARLST